MKIEVLLLDADGVIQTKPPGWRENLGALLGFAGDPTLFLADVWASEMPALSGQSHFPESLAGVLQRWGSTVTLDQALEVWTSMDLEHEVLGIVRSIRSQGIRCYLASNQEAFKARYMSQVLGYRSLFDGEFYSCDLGLSKPSLEYFQAILTALGVSGEQVLFIDDRPVNIAGAIDAGITAALFHRDSGCEMFAQILAEHGLRVATS